MLLEKSIALPFKAFSTSHGGGQGDEVGRDAKRAQHEHQLFRQPANRRASAGLRTIVEEQAGPTESKAQLALLLSKYRGSCGELGLTPNTGVERAISQGGMFFREQICLAHFGLTDVGLVPVAKLFEMSPKLTALDVSDNGLADRGALTLLDALAEHQALRALDLRSNPQVGPKSLKPLLAFVLQRPCVAELGLEGTGLGAEEVQVLQLQAQRNRRRLRLRYGGGGAALPLRLLAASRAEQRVEQLAQRFGLLEGEGVPQLHFTSDGRPTDPEEDQWEKNAEFDMAGKLHRRWAAEVQAIRRLEDAALAEARLRLEQEVAWRWAHLSKGILAARRECSPEKELSLLLKRRLSATVPAMEAEMARIQFLRHRIQEYAPHSPGQRMLLSNSLERLGGLEHKLVRRKRHLGKMKAVFYAQAFLRLRRQQWEKRVGALLAEDTSLMSKDEMQEVADQLSILVERGLQMVSDRCLGDAQVTPARKRHEELICSIERKVKLMKRLPALGASAIVAVMRLKGSIVPQVTSNATSLEYGLRQLLQECQSWEERLTLEEVKQARENLQKMQDAAVTRHSQLIDAETLAKVQHLKEAFDKHLGRWDHRQGLLMHYESSSTLLLGAATFKDVEHEQATLRHLSGEVSRFVSEVDQQEEGGAHRPEDVQLREALRAVSRSLMEGVEALHRGPQFFGLTLVELRGKVSVLTLLPLQEALLRVAGSEGSEVAAADLDALRAVLQKMQQFGYKTVTTLASDENAVVSKESLSERMAKWGIVDLELVARLHRMLEPFTFANFRRLLASPAVSGPGRGGGGAPAALRLR